MGRVKESGWGYCTVKIKRPDRSLGENDPAD
jgi:hypothetical protein